MNGEHASYVAGLAEGMRSLMRRLRQVLLDEMEDLAVNRLDNLEEYARQKDLLLLDLSRLAATAPDEAALVAHLREELAELKVLLDENAAVIARQLEAAREFTGFVEDTIRRHTTDGTYSRKAMRAHTSVRTAGALGQAARAYGQW